MPILHGRNRNPYILHRQNRTMPILRKIKVSVNQVALVEMVKNAKKKNDIYLTV